MFWPSYSLDGQGWRELAKHRLAVVGGSLKHSELVVFLNSNAGPYVCVSLTCSGSQAEMVLPPGGQLDCLETLVVTAVEEGGGPAIWCP